jgi:xylulokinase
MKLLIGLDVGTSALKGILVTSEGTVLAHAKKLTQLRNPQPGYHELDAEQHYRDLCEVLQELGENIPEKPAAPDNPAENQLVGLCMAAASGNSLMLDSQLTPLIPIISWMDGRAANQREETLPDFDYDSVLNISGWHWTDSFPLAIFAWYRKNHPDLYAAAARYCMNSDYLYYRLTGKWAMDPSTATTFYLADQRTATWNKPYLEAPDIKESQLSTLLPSGTDIGQITPQATEDTGLPLNVHAVLGAFDHPCAARGTGTLNPGEVLLSCGTSWVGFYVLESREKAVEAKFLIDPFLSPDGPWAGMFSLPYIGQTVEWYARETFLKPGDSPTELWKNFDQEAQQEPPAPENLFVTPFFDTVARKPIDLTPFTRTSAHQIPTRTNTQTQTNTQIQTNTQTRTSTRTRTQTDGGAGPSIETQTDDLTDSPLDNESESKTGTPRRGSIARAVMEGAAFEIRTLLQTYAGKGIPARRITMVGGPSESPIWPQLVSDITGLTIRIPSNGRHAGALGAAVLAGIGTGIFADEQEGWKAVQGTVRLIEPDPEQHAVYEKLYPLYLEHAAKHR